MILKIPARPFGLQPRSDECTGIAFESSNPSKRGLVVLQLANASAPPPSFATVLAALHQASGVVVRHSDREGLREVLAMTLGVPIFHCGDLACCHRRCFRHGRIGLPSTLPQTRTSIFENTYVRTYVFRCESCRTLNHTTE